MKRLSSVANTCLFYLLLTIAFIGVAGCETNQKKVDSLDTTDVVNDSTESLRGEITQVTNKKTKEEIIEEKIGSGWEELGRVNASLAVKSNGELTILGLNGLYLYLYAKNIGDDVIYQATTRKIEDWGDTENDLELVTKGDFYAYYRGEEYHFNATALSGWYFNLP